MEKELGKKRRRRLGLGNWQPPSILQLSRQTQRLKIRWQEQRASRLRFPFEKRSKPQPDRRAQRGDAHVTTATRTSQTSANLPDTIAARKRARGGNAATAVPLSRISRSSRSTGAIAHRRHLQLERVREPQQRILDA